MSKPDPNLWKTYGGSREDALKAFIKILDEFIASSVGYNDDLTGREARRELFEHFALHFGFCITWPSPAPAEQGTGEGGK